MFNQTKFNNNNNNNINSQNYYSTNTFSYQQNTQTTQSSILEKSDFQIKCPFCYLTPFIGLEYIKNTPFINSICENGHANSVNINEFLPSCKLQNIFCFMNSAHNLNNGFFCVNCKLFYCSDCNYTHIVNNKHFTIQIEKIDFFGLLFK